MLWYHLHNSKNVKNTHGGVLILVNLQALTCKFTKSNTPPWVFFPFSTHHKWNWLREKLMVRGAEESKVNMEILIKGISQLSLAVSRLNDKAEKVLKTKTHQKENNIHNIINI